VTVIVAARREAERIGDKLRTLAEQRYPPDLLDVVLACDGAADHPDDATPRAAAAHLGARLRVLALPDGGKAVALNAAVAAARGEVLVFTDARQRLSADAVAALVEDLADPAVGAVGGELVLDGGAPASAYWRYEKWIRSCEARAGSTVGVSGCLYAMRRALWQPLPPGTVLDDVLTPLRVRRAGFRVAFEPAARAFDDAAPTEREFRRKVRTLAGNFQLLALAPWLLSPRCPGFFAFASHKLARLAVPWVLTAVLVASYALPSPWRNALIAAQAFAYGLAALGPFAPHVVLVAPLARLAAAFVALNAAAVAGLFRFLAHRRRMPW
jgi:cellulose synthase/poly-beta-1,6-N-acetylglucosamine synthase-like glycosyltransferase